MFGLSVAETLGFGLLGPIITLVYAGVFGYIIGVLANKVIKFNIPVMEEGNADLSMAGAMAILGWSFAVSGNLGYVDIVKNVLMTGYIASSSLPEALPFCIPSTPIWARMRSRTGPW